MVAEKIFIFIELILMADANNKQPKNAGFQRLTNPMMGVMLASICFAAAYISCQPVEKELGGTSIAQTALTTEQRTSFNDTINAIGRIESAVIEIKGLGAVPAITDQTEQDIKNAMTAVPSCQESYSKATATVGARQSTLNVTGNSCPLIASYESKYSPGTPAGPYSLLATFKITDATLKSKNDIYEIALTGQGTHSFSNDHGAVHTDVSGTLQSASLGQIEVSISNQQNFFTDLNGTSVEGTRSIQLSFPALSVQKPAFQAVLRVDFAIKENQDQSKYQLNGVDISKAEYESYIQKLGILAL
jgi:hypothetical protein